MAGERAASLADDFAAANAEAIAFAGSCTEEQWHTVVPGEEWTVGVVLHHIAEGHALGLTWMQAMARGEAVLDTADGIDRRNVDHAARAGGSSVAETVALLGSHGALTEAALRRLTDEELDRTAPFGPAHGQPFPVEQMAAQAARHTRGHLGHARDAVAAGS